MKLLKFAAAASVPVCFPSVIPLLPICKKLKSLFSRCEVLQDEGWILAGLAQWNAYGGSVLKRLKKTQQDEEDKCYMPPNFGKKLFINKWKVACLRYSDE